jgi:tetraacyldisaccharide 4'-kinase
LLLPFSFLYSLAVELRNKLFDWKILKSTAFDLPIISIGNITLGGTGKTPHIELLIEILNSQVSTGVLSRGFKRSTKGFRLATENSTPSEIGDEPYQVFSRFKSITLGVCESRVTGVENLLRLKSDLKVILLDDAFQHRYIKPGLSIVLVDYNRPIFTDFLLPAGNLRERCKSIKRADIVIVTKTPAIDISAIQKEWIKSLKLNSRQCLYFSGFVYDKLRPVFNENHTAPTITELNSSEVNVLLLTGIAYPASLVRYIKSLGLSFEFMQFSDHHNFSIKDLEKIENRFKRITSENKFILTTEKDAVRLQHLQAFPKELKKYCYFLPVKVEILNNEGQDFNRKIIDYVKQN